MSERGRRICMWYLEIVYIVIFMFFLIMKLELFSRSFSKL